MGIQERLNQVNLEQISDEMLEMLLDEVKDLWEEEDKEFLKKLALDIATQKVLAAQSDNPEEHKKNLEHLLVTMRGEVLRREVKLNKRGRELFIRLLSLVVKVAIKTII
jgi:hypothetical protein